MSAFRGLTLTQPWASLVALGHKTIETRSWPTSYRGPVAIHAAKGFPEDARLLATRDPFSSCLGMETLHRGVIVAVATLHACFQFDERTAGQIRERSILGRLPESEVEFGDYAPGRFGFVLTSVRRLVEPIPARGMLSLWAVPDDVAERLSSPPAPVAGLPKED